MIVLQPSKEIDFLIRNKIIIIIKKWFKKIILLMLKDDVMFKGVVAWFENTI